MKRIISIACLVMFFAACGESKVINGKHYETCGLINSDSCKSPEIRYEPCIGNVIWGIVFSETIIAPIYFWGYSMYNPVAPK